MSLFELPTFRPVEEMTQEERDAEYRLMERKLREMQNEKLRRATEEALRYFRPLPKQQAFHLSSKRNCWIFGANRGSKSMSGAIKDVLHALGPNAVKYIEAWPDEYELKGVIYEIDKQAYIEYAKSIIVPNKGWICTESFEVQRDVIQDLIMKWLPKPEIKGRPTYRMGKIIDQIPLKNGSTITFKSYDQGREKFQGASVHWVHEDEEAPDDIHQEIRMRLLDTKGHMWSTMTPLKGLTSCYKYYLQWLSPEGLQDPEAYVDVMSWEDNPYLDDEEKARLIADMTEDEKEARVYGRFIIPGKCPFATAKLLKMRDKLCRDPVKYNVSWKNIDLVDLNADESSDGDFMVWVKPTVDGEYIVSADVAEGLEHGDYSVAGAWDRHTKELCAVWHGKCDPDVFGDIIHRMATWYNHAVEVPERNNHGLTTITYIKNLDHNLYRERTMGKRVDSDQERYGWTTSWVTKPVMVDALARVIREESLNVYWTRFYDECQGFVRDGKGRYGARVGSWDDIVMMAAIFVQVDGMVESVANMPAPFTGKSKKVVFPWEKVKKQDDEWKEETW